MYYFIGLDDTDTHDSIGTGALARELMLFLIQNLLAVSHGITRHQFLIHPEIPYTTHNSSACLKIQSDMSLKEIINKCREFIQFLFHPGADPGLCITFEDQFNNDILNYAKKAQLEVVKKEEAIFLAKNNNILLEEHGGEGIGIIGALSGCFLRMDGNDGRFIAHKGIREAKPHMTSKEIISKTAVELIVDENGSELRDQEVIITNNWIRPDLINNKIIMKVKYNQQNKKFFVEKQKKGYKTKLSR